MTATKKSCTHSLPSLKSDIPGKKIYLVVGVNNKLG